MELAKNKSIQDKLYREVSALKKKAGQLSGQNTKGLVYLQAVINEATRLFPPGPSGSQSIVGPDGLNVNGIFIPPSTVVRVHALTMHTGGYTYSEDP